VYKSPVALFVLKKISRNIVEVVEAVSSFKKKHLLMRFVYIEDKALRPFLIYFVIKLFYTKIFYKHKFS